MSNLAIRLKAEPQRAIVFGNITTSYVGIGSPYTNPVRLYMLQNLTDQILQFSWDGIHDHFPLAAGGSMILDITSNKSATGGMFAAAEGDRTYVLYPQDPPTTGTVYLTIFYGFEK